MTSEQYADDDPLDPERARQNPEDALDALESRVLGGTRLPGDEQDDAHHRDDEEPVPAFELDLDPGDQGSAAAAASNPD